MPWDVSTRWNSTYDMLKFVCTYHDAINKITDDRAMKLCEYELKDDELKSLKSYETPLRCVYSSSLFIFSCYWFSL